MCLYIEKLFRSNFFKSILINLIMENNLLLKCFGIVFGESRVSNTLMIKIQ